MYRLPAPLWSELIALRSKAATQDPVFPSRSGKFLDRGRVRMILRQAAGRVGIEGNVSPHWLRHAHASHALDHGAPIHLVQATLGHSSVATTSAYLHARPGDSSARYLASNNFSIESSKSALQSSGTRVMDVVAAADAAKGDYKMTTSTTEEQITQETIAAQEPKATKSQP